MRIRLVDHPAVHEELLGSLISTALFYGGLISIRFDMEEFKVDHAIVCAP